VAIRHLRDNPAVWPLLEERARTLAIQELTAQTKLGEAFLTFRLGDGGYSLPARAVREVRPFGACTPLPATPSFVVGLVNVRGRLLAVLDLRPLLDSPLAAPQPGASLLVVAANGMEVGLLADAVIEVRHSADELAPAPSATAGRSAAWVRGVDRDLNLRLDLAALLADPRLIVNGASQ
jgi:purine-binding chemotaxis protein CheW